MLRVGIHDSANVLTIKFEGRFTGNAAENTCTLLTRCPEGMRLVVDLTDIIFIDAVGENVLASFGRFGAEFVAQTSYTFDVCERLNLRLAKGGASDSDPSAPLSKNGRQPRLHKPPRDNEQI